MRNDDDLGHAGAGATSVRTARYARRMAGVQPSAIRELLRLGSDPEIISFGGGYPDPALFPVDELHEVYAGLLVPERALALQYTATNGLPRSACAGGRADDGRRHAVRSR